MNPKFVPLLVCIAVCGLVVAAGGCSPGAATEKAPSKAFHRAAGTGTAFWGPGDLYTVLASGDETNDAYFQFEAIVPPGGGPPAHVHGLEDETFYLAEGNLEMLLGDKTVAAQAGDFVNIPKGTVHRFKNVGSGTAKMIVTFVPAGMEKYFAEVFPKAKDRTATPPPVTEELLRKMTAAAAKHSLQFVPAAEPVKP